jgi:chromosome segregation ATPase
MIEHGILDEALNKKNKEIERLQQTIEETKRNYETKIKNLMGSINELKNKKNELEISTKDNVRVNLINKAKEERKDQEIVIGLLRKLINDEEKVDKYLLKEFDKKGKDHIPTYEELKIKIKHLEGELVNFKLKQKDMKNNTKNTVKAELDNSEIIPSNILNRYKERIVECEEKIDNLQEENKILSESKNKMEKMQNELFEKMKKYNKEIGEMKSIYEGIKKNIEEECNLKIKDLSEKIKKSETENTKYKERIAELIQLSEGNNQGYYEKIKQLSSENEILKRLLESKKQEIKTVLDELAKYQNHFDKVDNKEVIKTQKVEKEKEEVKRKVVESEEKIKYLEKVIKQKDYQLDLYKQSLSDKDELIIEKEGEIDLLLSKIQELENIIVDKYN